MPELDRPTRSMIVDILYSTKTSTLQLVHVHDEFVDLRGAAQN
jgi:hypothetical protein